MRPVESAPDQRDHPDREGRVADQAANRSGLVQARTKVARWYEGSFLRRLFARLDALDFMNQAILFGAGLLVTLLPFLVLLSAFASERVDDDIALHLGLDHRAEKIVSHLFNQAPAKVTSGMVLSFVIMLAGTLTVAASLQQIYEKTFDQSHQGGVRAWPRYILWLIVMCAVVGLVSIVGRPVRNLPGGFALIDVLTLAVFAPFMLWTMHFLLAGRVSWARLVPSALATGLFAAGLGVFSALYFSSTIISDDRIYGPIGAVFSLVTWMIAIGAVVILGAVAGVLWQERHE
jgi:membrane protein